MAGEAEDPNDDRRTELDRPELDRTEFDRTEFDQRSKPRRKRGAQPGNQNAYKHGFYSRYFEYLEADDLDSMLSEGLQDEIAMMRVVARRVMKLSQGINNYDEAVTVLGALGMASSRLASLLRTQKLLGGQQPDEVTAAISQALSDVIKELGIE